MDPQEPRFDPTVFPVVIDCFGRAVSGFKSEMGNWYKCPFCGNALLGASLKHGNKCLNPACDAREGITREIALTRAHVAAIAEDGERERAMIRRVRYGA